MRPAAETVARIAVAERNQLDPRRYPSWDEMTSHERATELHAAHRIAEVFGLFGRSVEVVGDAVIERRTITRREAPGPHPIVANMAQAEQDAMEYLR